MLKMMLNGAYEIYMQGVFGLGKCACESQGLMCMTEVNSVRIGSKLGKI